MALQLPLAQLIVPKPLFRTPRFADSGIVACNPFMSLDRMIMSQVLSIPSELAEHLKELVEKENEKGFPDRAEASGLGIGV